MHTRRPPQQKNLPTLKTIILALCPIRFGGGVLNDQWGFVAEIVEGKWKDRYMVGLYKTEEREGFFDIVPSPQE
ncbi:MAG: hypothetical protein AAB791_02230 [Patescibacteria group bacterium]